MEKITYEVIVLVAILLAAIIYRITRKPIEKETTSRKIDEVVLECKQQAILREVDCQQKINDLIAKNANVRKSTLRTAIKLDDIRNTKKSEAQKQAEQAEIARLQREGLL
jgi:hypothetical protein